MKLRVNNTDIEPKRVRDRIEFRFDSGSDLDYVTLRGSDIFGDMQLSEIQLEQSTVSTQFVEPMVSETVASGLFKSVQGISYEITSPDSDTWAQIKQSVEGSITTYHNGPLQSTLALTVNDVIFGIRDIVSGDQASFNLRLDGIQQVVKDEMFESVQTQLSNFVGIELQDVEGRINTIQSTVSGSAQKISNLEGDFNVIQSTVEGTIQTIGDIEGNISTIQSTAKGTIREISDLEGNLNTIQSTVQGTVQRISDIEGNITTIQSTAKGTLQRISNIEGDINTIQSTAKGTVQRISNIEGDINTIQSTAKGTIKRITDAEDNINTVQRTASSNYQSLTTLSGAYNTTKNTVNSMSKAIGTNGGKVAQLVMSDSIFKVDVIDEIAGAKSSVNVLSDSIGLRASGNTIYIGGEGIRIDAESIYLGSSTQIGDGVITNRMIASNAKIDAAKISNLTVSDAQITSLDVSKLSGNKADFVSAAFNGINSTTTIDSLGMSINSSNSWKMYLGSGGMRIRTNSGHQVGSFRAGINARGEPEGSYIMAERGYYAGIGHIRNDSSGLYYASLFDDSTGDVTYFDERDFRGGSLFDSIMKYNLDLGSAGSYIRIGDIQIAWRTINTDLTPNQTNGNIFRSNTGTSSFPAPFASTPVVVMSSAFAGRWVDITGNPTLTDVSYRLYSSLSSTATGGVYYIAIGRWK